MSFKRMDEAKLADWEAIYKEARSYQGQMPERMLNWLKSLGDLYMGFGVSQLHHCLQTATMAYRAQASDEIVLCALVHDAGKVISSANHGGIIAEIMKPFVSDGACQILRHHQDFQGQYYYGHVGRDPQSYTKFKGEEWYEQALQFGAWDQAAFDPSYKVLLLNDFTPLLQSFLSDFPLQWKKTG